MQFITRPLLTWPRPNTTNRRRSPYSVDYHRILHDLDYELEKLGAKGNVEVRLDIAANTRVRNDGLPFAESAVRSPRVGVAFLSRHGPLVYYCDRFLSWEGNLRAIGLGLERLRLVEDTGIVSRGEQYSGFKALGAGIPLAMTVQDAARVLTNLTSAVPNNKASETLILERQDCFESALRSAQMKHHPDAGGRREDWDQVQAAGEVLKKHFEGSRR